MHITCTDHLGCQRPTFPHTPLCGMQASSAERQAYEHAVSQEPRLPGPWMELMAYVRQSGDLNDICDVYDRFLEHFPQASAQWIEYVNLALSQSNFDQADAIFVRCLRSTLSMDLWKVYLAYVRRVHPLPPFTGEENSPRDQTRRILEASYEYALKHIGWDRDSGPIWQDYIQLVREREARGAWQEGQKMDQLRRIYQRAVSTPMNHIEAIWKEYDAYENSLNKLTAKKFLAEHSPAYMQARAVLGEMKPLTDGLVRPSLPTPPSWIVPNSRAAPQKEHASYEAWHAYLAWEQTNPLALQDHGAWQHRVLCAYKKATMYIRFDAVVWYMAAHFCRTVQRENDMLVWLRDGIDACPWSILLRFTYADISTRLGRFSDATAALDDLVDYAQAQVDKRLSALADAKARIDEHMATERKQRLDKRAQLDSVPDDDDGDKAELADIERRVQEERDQQCQQLEKEAEATISVWRDAVSQVWIKYMQFVRRSEGIRAARQIFSRARKSKHCSWQVYEASAMLEYHCAKEALVATKVFELALKTFGPDEHLVVRYLDFLLSVNDDANARAVLERTVSSLPPERARIVWDRWATYEYNYGDASGIARLETRMSDLYPGRPAVQSAAHKLQYRTLDWVRAHELGMEVSMARPKESKRKAESRSSASEVSAPEPTKTSDSKADAPSSGGRTMEDIRRSLATSADPVKRTRGKSEEKSTKKSKSTVHDAPRKGARDTPPPSSSSLAPPPVPTIPDAILYFISLLPHAMTYDGPPIPPEAIFECLARSRLPLLPDARKAVAKRRP